MMISHSWQEEDACLNNWDDFALKGGTKEKFRKWTAHWGALKIYDHVYFTLIFLVFQNENLTVGKTTQI